MSSWGKEKYFLTFSRHFDFMLSAKQSKKSHTIYPLAQYNNPKDWNLQKYKLLGSKEVGNLIC
jgi:hypothetical protein